MRWWISRRRDHPKTYILFGAILPQFVNRSARTDPRPALSRIARAVSRVYTVPSLPVRFYGVTRIAAGSVAAAAGLICLAYGVYGWAAFFLVIGGLNLAGGYWYITIVRSASARA